MRISCRAMLIGVVSVSAACNNNPADVDPPVLTSSVSSADTWAGGTIRVMLRGGDDEAPIPIVRVGGTPLTIARHDDTTFTVTLPVTPGTVTLQIEQPDGATSTHDVKLRGFVGQVFRPSVEGKLLHVPGGTPTEFYGAMTDGLVQFSVATGLPTRKWGDSTHSLLCNNTVGTGWRTGEILLRGKNAQGACGAYYTWRPTGDQLVRMDSYGTSGRYPMGFLHETKYITGTIDDHAANIMTCVPGGGCTTVIPTPKSFLMWSVGVSQARKRLVTHASDGGLYSLETGELVYAFGRRSMRIKNSAFSVTGDTIYVVADGDLNAVFASGTVFQLTDAGVMLDSIMTQGAPRAIAEDPVRGLLYVAEVVTATQKMELRGYDKKTLQLVTVQPMDAGTGSAFAQMDYFEVVIDEASDHLYIVGTLMSSASGPQRIPAIIAKFSLPAA